MWWAMAVGGKVEQWWGAAVEGRLSRYISPDQPTQAQDIFVQTNQLKIKIY